MQISKSFLGMAALIAMVGQSAIAQNVSNNRVAAKTDWSVFVEENPKECWGVSVPTETVNTRDGRVVAANRGEILLMVFFRPSAEASGQVAFTGGYPFREGSQVSVEIGGSEFSLFTDGDWAWPASAADDAKLVAAMKRGSDAVVTGLSSRGTTTKDTFSLLGFTAAVEDAETRCAS
ncbi:invasion associated locus B family protein [Roseobacter weihaiensis]|uniref:invasion associated locus B family protein n=1 Tax=Roseobacter weihaiensis TaxID=2763262 RepID=UPI001D0B4131|nr:invasion associated locus B family protein [Roseobacter sp. H9]